MWENVHILWAISQSRYTNVWCGSHDVRLGDSSFSVLNSQWQQIPHILSFKGSESDCLHILALTLFGLSDLPLTLHYSSCVVASIVSRQSLSLQLSLRSPGEVIWTRLQNLKGRMSLIGPSNMVEMSQVFLFSHWFYFVLSSIIVDITNIVSLIK